MTIYELIKADIEKLNSIRVPMNEPMIYRQISEVLMDLQACAKAIEDSEKQQAEEKKPEGDENIIKMDVADVVNE